MDSAPFPLWGAPWALWEMQIAVPACRSIVFVSDKGVNLEKLWFPQLWCRRISFFLFKEQLSKSEHGFKLLSANVFSPKSQRQFNNPLMTPRALSHKVPWWSKLSQQPLFNSFYMCAFAYLCAVIYICRNAVLLSESGDSSAGWVKCCPRGWYIAPF